jgi:hypothetical protein
MTSLAIFAAIRPPKLLAHEGRIENRIAWRGNYTPGGCETSKNVALTCDYGLAKLNCVSFTTAHNILRHCMTSCGNPSLCEAREHVVC